MLPCSGFQIDGRYADGRRFLDAKGKLAIATNYNPGSAPCRSLPMAIALAVRYLGISVSEAITASTHDSVELDMQALVAPELADNEDFTKALVEGLVAVNDEDIAINKRTWRGMHSRNATMGPLSRYEEGVKRFPR